MEWVALWVIMAFVCAMIAESKGRSFFAFWVYGLLIWPIALVHVLVVPKTEKRKRVDAAEGGRVPCPACAEMILPEAKVCRYCGRDVQPA